MTVQSAAPAEQAPLNRFEQRRLRTQSQLKAAIVELLHEQSIGAIRIQDVTERANLGVGTFYVHFKDKEDIIWAVLLDVAKDLEGRMEYYLPKMLKDYSQAYFLWLSAFEFFGAHRDMFRMIIGVNGYPVLAAKLQSHIASVAEAKMGTIELPDVFMDLPTSFLSQYLSGAMLQLLRWWLDQDTGYTAQEMATMFCRMTLKAEPPVLPAEPSV